MLLAGFWHGFGRSAQFFCQAVYFFGPVACLVAVLHSCCRNEVEKTAVCCSGIDGIVPAATGGKWKEIFESYAIQGAIVPLRKQTSPGRLARELHEDAGWALVAFDDRTLFFLRRDSKPQDFFNKNEFRLIWPGDRTLEKLTSKTAPDSRAEAKRALEFDSSSVFARTVYARSLLLDGRFRFAAIEYRKLVSENKVSEEYWRDYAYSLYMAGKYRELLSVLDKMEDDGLFPEYAGSLRDLLKRKSE